jgi:hypothetical protein
MRRPVWLFSLDTEQFDAPPMATGGLKAYFVRHGATAAATDVALVHFHRRAQVDAWLRERWVASELARAREAVTAGLRPLVGFSVYTWNAAEFLDAMHAMRASCPEVLIVAGGPHVQRAEDYVGTEGVDAVVLGEGEITFTELLDRDRSDWKEVAGLALIGADGKVVRTGERPRTTDFDAFPSPLDAIELRDAEGRPRYGRVAYETTRGCPFRCAFCEWGTGAIGTKMFQHGLPRVRDDFERVIAGGVQDLWLCDSNFGALPEDLDKARMVVELKQRTGMPSTFATSWSKNHNARVGEIVKLLHTHGLLQDYNLALQTLTPEALRLSNRRNMRSNQYEPIAREMTAHGVPIATELIWGLPGDNLVDFEKSLDRLTAVFPNVNIFGHTLLPGTEFHERRDEYRIETIPVAGYGKAKGEYVVGCHTFSREEGMEGYFLITAHIVLVRGWVMPFVARALALDGRVPVSPLLREVLRALAARFASAVPGLDPADRMGVYEGRDELYLAMLAERDAAFSEIRGVLDRWLTAHSADDALRALVLAALALDEAFCPRSGPSHDARVRFGCDAGRVAAHLERMELPPAAAVRGSGTTLRIHHPGGVGEVLSTPDGGRWMRGRVVSDAPVLRVQASAAS